MLVTVSEQCEKKLLAVKQEEKSGTTHVGLSSELKRSRNVFNTHLCHPCMSHTVVSCNFWSESEMVWYFIAVKKYSNQLDYEVEISIM